MSNWVDAAGNRWRFSDVNGCWEKEVSLGQWVVTPVPQAGLRRDIGTLTPGTTIIETMGPAGLPGRMGDRGPKGDQGDTGSGLTLTDDGTGLFSIGSGGYATLTDDGSGLFVLQDAH